jgi:hypothetical protein
MSAGVTRRSRSGRNGKKSWSIGKYRGTETAVMLKITAKTDATGGVRAGGNAPGSKNWKGAGGRRPLLTGRFESSCSR